MIGSIFQSALAGWLWRRVQEIGGLASILMPIYFAAPPEVQGAVMEILQGRGGGLSLTAAFGLVVYAFSQFQSLRATIKPQVVTAEGQKITPKKDSVAMERIETQAKAAPKQQTLAEKLFDRIFGN